ncbi:glycine hydroxymethyltransferase [Monoraphidium neglectum]|uniref:Glycine hydroxymethyltransferase n=1 Tax=Monoraphidium neglectum TaxID=145388 RepID=A0A0D2JKH3_9CHLO|nr:glycine hydroxymethyltransferase [Monoraphidium neglectum]KIY99752.1 glycine hydroxymethyltransferase [Monoraphidium neglectum]|eukprot:XP_013898772.1 glycine hydroxymethyltransferase [Monoraphidium neglectum]
MVPGGLRMGSPALTSRGFVEKDFEKVAEFVDRAVNIAVALKAKAGAKLKDFRDYLDKNQVPEIEALREEVEAFAKTFPTVGFEKASMKYTE